MCFVYKCINFVYKYLNDHKIIQPLEITFFPCDLAFCTRSCSIFPNHNEIVLLARTGFSTNIHGLVSMGSSRSRPLLRQWWEFFPLHLLPSLSSLTKAVWCLPASPRMGKWPFQLVLPVSRRERERPLYLLPWELCAPCISFKDFFIYTGVRQTFQHASKLFS